MHVLLNGPKKKQTEYGSEVQPHFMVICNTRLTTDEISFQGVLFFPFAYIKVAMRDPRIGRERWIDVFFARTAFHSALATTQNRNQLTENFTLSCCEIALRIFSAKIAPNFSSKAACANAIENY